MEHSREMPQQTVSHTCDSGLKLISMTLMGTIMMTKAMDLNKNT